jgi:RNA polymerase sigma-70 factor (ECF subfamily)
MSDAVLTSVSQVVETYYGELRSYARRKVGNIALAEDLVQEACLRLASAEAGKIDNPRAFLYRVIGNLVIDHRRGEQVRARYLGGMVDDDLEFADETSNVERQCIARQELAALSRAIAELPPRCRECFVLRRFEDLSHKEIARRMGISRNMVEKHLRHALVYCAARLSDDD